MTKCSLTIVLMSLCFIQYWISWTFLNVPCHLSSASHLNVGEQKRRSQSLYMEKKKKISPWQYMPTKKHHLIAFSCLHFEEMYLKASWHSRALCCLIIQFLMFWAELLNAAFSNSKGFSLVFTSCTFSFIWRVNVCDSSRTAGREIYRTHCRSFTETKSLNLRSAFALQSVRKSGLQNILIF